MKKTAAILLSLLILTASLLGGWWWLFRSPRGVYRADLPQNVMQQLIDERSPEDWESFLLPCWEEDVTEFEDRAEIFHALFSETVQGAPLLFREIDSHGHAEVRYLLTAEDRPVCIVRLRYADGSWQSDVEAELVPGSFTAETRTLTISVPEGCVPLVNGKTVSDEWKTALRVYEDMSELEKTFETVPMQQCYVISGIYRTPDVEMPGCTLFYADGEIFRFLPADAREHGFRVIAPADASVAVCGSVLGEAMQSGSVSFSTGLELPPELEALLPRYAVYEADGLYSEPQFRVTSAIGALLSPVEQSDGSILFLEYGTDAPPEDLRHFAEGFMTECCRYGAAIDDVGAMTAFMDLYSPLWDYYYRASASLSWVRGTGLTVNRVWSDNYRMLDETHALCSTHAECTLQNYYNTYDVTVDYDLYCSLENNGWRVLDMVYR